MKFKVGDKVKIVKERTGEMNKEGDMDEYLGKIMTIVEIRNTWGRESYKMKEDKGEWYWYADMIEGLAQFTKSDLKDGDIVTYRNGDKRTIKTGDLLNKNKIVVNKLDNYKKDLTDKGKNTELDIVKVERLVSYKTVFERKEEILDKVEKRYLRGVIRPFRDEIRGIIREQLNDECWISIDFKNDTYMDFPSLKSKESYKNMKAGKIYSLEELRTIKE